MNFKKLITAMAGTALVLTPTLSVTACNKPSEPGVITPEPDSNKVMSLKAISALTIDRNSLMPFPDPQIVTPDQLRLFFDSIVMMNVRKLGGAAATAVKNTDYSYTLQAGTPAGPLTAPVDLTAAAPGPRTFTVTITAQNDKKLRDSSSPITVVIDPMVAKVTIATLAELTISEAKAKATIEPVDNEYKMISGTVVRGLFAIVVNEAIRALGTEAATAVEYTDYTFTLKQNSIDVDSSGNYNFSATGGLSFVVTINSVPTSKYILGNTVPITVAVPQLLKS